MAREEKAKSCLSLAAAVVPLAAAAMSATGHAAVFTSVQDGLYNNNATWSGGAANPATGSDTVTINNVVTITTTSWVTGDTINTGSNAAVIALQNSTASSFNATAVDLSATNQAITSGRGASGSGVTHTLGGTLTLGSGREVAISAGANVTNNSNFGITLSGTGTVTGAQSFLVNNNGTGVGTLTLGAGISGSGSFVKSGDGALTLGGSSTFTGGVTMNAGTLRLAQSSSGTVASITDGPVGRGTLALNGGAVTASSTTARSILNAWTFGGDVTLGASSGNTGTLTFSGAGTISGATRQLTINGRVNLDGDIGQSTAGLGLTKAGSAMLVLGGTNSFTGALTVNAGTLRLGSAGAWNTSGSNLVLNGTTLELGAGNITTSAGTGAGQIQVLGAAPALGAVGGDRTLNVGSVTWGSADFAPTTLTLGTSQSDSKIVLAGNIALNGATRSFTVIRGTATGADAEVSAIISGAAGVTQKGSGNTPATLKLTGDNTFDGPTNVWRGVLEVSTIGNWATGNTTASPLGSPTTASNGRIGLGEDGDNTSQPGTLRYTGGGETTNRTFRLGATDLTGTPSPINGGIEASGTGALIISSDIQNGYGGSDSAGVLILGGTSSNENTLQGAIKDNNTGGNQTTGLVKNGSGTWVLTNSTSNYGRGTTLNAGTLILRGDQGELDTGLSGTFTASSGTVTGISDADIAKISVGDVLYGGMYNRTHKGGVVNAITLSPGNNSLTLATTANNGGVQTFEASSASGVLGKSHSAVVIGSATTEAGDAPRLLIDGAYTFAAPLTVASTATTAATYGIGGLSASQAATFSGAVTTNRDLILSQTAGGTLNITGGITGSTVVDTSALITFAGPGSINVATTGMSDGTGGGTGKLSVRVFGGTTTFAAANTYTGNTTVDGGTLMLTTTGSIASASAVTVNSGGTLAGNGTVNGAALIQGTLAPGASEGKLTFGDDLTLAGTTVLEIEGTTRGVNNGYDAVDVASDLTYGGALSLNFQNLTAFANGQTFDLFATGTVPGGDLSSVTVTGFYSGTLTNDAGVWSATFGGQKLSFSENTGDLTIVAVPEPATLGLIGVAGAMLVRRRRQH